MADDVIGPKSIQKGTSPCSGLRSANSVVGNSNIEKHILESFSFWAYVSFIVFSIVLGIFGHHVHAILRGVFMAVGSSNLRREATASEIL